MSSDGINLNELFENKLFFSPLASKNRQVYFDCFCKLMDRSLETTILYEQEARDIISLYLLNNQAENEDGVMMDASMIMAKLRDCGWVEPRKVGRTGDYETVISQTARYFVDCIRNFGEGRSQTTMSHNIQLMYDYLRGMDDPYNIRSDQPYRNLYLPLLEACKSLKEELYRLRSQIPLIIQAASILNDIQSITSLFSSDETQDQFFEDYFFIKNKGLVGTQITYVNRKLNEMLFDEKYEHIRKKIIERGVVDRDLERDDMEADFENEIHKVIDYLSYEFQRGMKETDRQINEYLGLLNKKYALVYRSEFDIEAALDKILSFAGTLEADEFDEIMSKHDNEWNLYESAFMDVDAFVIQTRKQSNQTGAVIIERMSRNEVKKELEKARNKAFNPYSKDQVSKAIDRLMNGSSIKAISELDIQSREDAVNAVMAAAYSVESTFDYNVEILEEDVKTESAVLSNMIIKRKRNVEGSGKEIGGREKHEP